MRRTWKALVVVLAALLTVAPAATAQAGRWSEQARVTGNTSHGQALAWFRNSLHVAAKGADNNRMYYTIRRAGTDWLNQAPFSQDWLTDQRPALAVFQDRLHLAWKGHNSTFIYLASTGDGVNWTAPIAISTESSHGPALAGFQGKLFLFWKDAASDAHHYKYGTRREWDWSPQKSLPGTADQGPSAVEFNERLHVAWKSPSGGLLTSSTGDSDTWDTPTGINGGTTHGPALGVFYNRLFLTWKGKSGDTRMYFASRD